MVRGTKPMTVTTATQTNNQFLAALANLCNQAMNAGMTMTEVVGLLGVHSANLSAQIVASIVAQQQQPSIAVPDAATAARLKLTNGHG